MKSVYHIYSIGFVLLFIIGTTASLNHTTPDPVNNELFIYHLTLTDAYNNPSNWTDETMRIINEHSDFLTDLGKQGILGFAGRTKFNPGDEHLFGIAVIRATSQEEAEQILSGDPAVQNNIQKAQVFPFSMGIRFLDNLSDD